jgi:predicted neuraminidase
MWSDGPGIEDRVGQRVKFATSADGLKWSTPKFMTPVPPNSDPDSPHYATHTDKGMRWISRGFWKRDGELLSLASLDEAAGFFGKSLELRAFRFDQATGEWSDAGLVFKNTINNFPPIKLRTGDWMMSRRMFDYSKTGVHFLVGGVKALDDWQSFSVLGSAAELKAEEPDWWILPDNRLAAVFRDNRRSGFLYRSLSTDDGRTWTTPVKTNFPDATSKISGLRLRDGRYVLVSNPNPKKRDPLTLSISEDGLVFTKMLYLVGGRHIDYPHVIEHDGSLFIAFAGGKQTVEVLKVKLSDVDEVKMPNQPLEVAHPAIRKSEFIYDTGAYPQIHATTLVETPSGLVAAWFGGTTEGNKDVCIWVSRQLPDGKWCKGVEAANGLQADGGRHPTWNPVLFQPEDGPLMLFYKVGPNPQMWWGMLTTSTDDGQTWEQPHRLPKGTLGPVKNKPFQLPDGSILCPTSEESPAKARGGKETWTIHFERTPDFGRTWYRTPPLHDGQNIQAIQPSILSLGGNKLLALGRTKQRKVFQITSDDAGKTWGEISLTDLPNPNSGTDAVTLADGRHLLIYNHTTTGRSPLNLALSKDGGAWEAALVLEKTVGEYSYPSIIQTNDNLVHITYTWKRAKVKHVIIDPAKLITKPIVNGQWPH